MLVMRVVTYVGDAIMLAQGKQKYKTIICVYFSKTMEKIRMCYVWLVLEFSCVIMSSP